MTESSTIGELGEFGLIDRIGRLLRPPDGAVVLGIGDDTAAIDTGAPALLLATVDMQVEGRHFLRGRTPPEALGRRAAAVNLSDIGSMGGAPRWALVSLALPPSLETAWVDDFYRGLDAMLGEFGAVVIGGNLSGSEAIIIDVTLLGEVPRESLLTRAGAKPGDLILVTGTLGRAAAGRAALDAHLDADEPDAEVTEVLTAHLSPTPRVREGGTLAAAGGVTSMMDISDGLAGDLAHILDASGVGALVQAAHLPLSPATLAVCERLNLDPVALALTGGEDFELLLTAAPEDVDRLRDALAEATGTPLTVIGEIRPPGDGRRLLLPGGAERRLTAAGWDHFRPA